MLAVYAECRWKSMPWRCVVPARILGIEEDGEAETSERRHRRDFTGADSGVAETSASDHSAQVIRKVAQIRGLESRDGGGLRTKGQAVLLAAPARIVQASGNCDAVCVEQARYLLFLFLARYRCDYGREILRGVILFAAAFNGDADGVHLRVEDIRAMRRRVHPGNVKCGNVGSLCDILRNQAEARTCQTQASLEISFTVEAVREGVMFGEQSGVETGGVRERGVPLQLTQAERCAFAVHRIVEHLFGGVGGASTSRGSGRGVRSRDDAENEDRRERDAHENPKNAMM